MKTIFGCLLITNRNPAGVQNLKKMQHALKAKNLEIFRFRGFYSD